MTRMVKVKVKYIFLSKLNITKFIEYQYKGKLMLNTVLIIYTVAGSVTQYGQKYDENINRYKQVLNRT